MSNSRKHTIAISFSLTCVLSLCACSGTSQNVSDKATTEAVSKEEPAIEEKHTMRVIGTEEKQAVEVTLTNGLGSQVSELSIRDSNTHYGSDLLTGTPLADGDAIVMRIPEGWKTFDLQIATSDGTHEFIGIPIKSTHDLKLIQSDDGLSASIVNASGLETIVFETKPEDKPTEDVPETTQPAPALESQSASESDASNFEEQQQQDWQSDDQYAQPYTEPEQYYTESAPEEPAYTYEVPMQAPDTTQQYEDSCMDDVVLKPGA